MFFHWFLVSRVALTGQGELVAVMHSARSAAPHGPMGSSVLRVADLKFILSKIAGYNEQLLIWHVLLAALDRICPGLF